MLLGYLVLKGYKDKDDTSSNFDPAAQRIEAIVQSQKTAAYQRKCNHHLNKYYPKMNDVDLCQHIGFVASDKLEQFDTFTLKKVANKQNNGEVTLKPVFIA